jgi:hypothetical protein
MYLEDKKQGEQKTVYCQVLLDAADFLEQHSWTKGTYHDYRYHGYCMVGSFRDGILHIETRPTRTSEEYEEWHINLNKYYQVYEHLCQYMWAKFDLNPITWNDSRAKTKQQVVDELRNAAYWKPLQRQQ